MARRPTTTETTKVKRLIDKLASDVSEAEIRETVGNLLQEVLPEHTADRRLEFSLSGGGRVDLLFPSAKFLVETKIRGKLKIVADHEQQLHGYLRDVGRMFQGDWRGVLTDGQIWHVYDWDRKADRLRKVRASFKLKGGRAGARGFLEFVRTCLAPEYRQGKPPPPADMSTAILYPFLQELVESPGGRQNNPSPAEQAERHRHFETKFDTWRDVLRGAGMLPPEREETRTRRLFREHTALVAVTRGIVSASRSSQGENDENVDREKLACRALDSGFISWLTKVEAGRKLAGRLFRDLAAIEWGDSTKDVLRSAYEQLIDKEDRKEFGEYYTPDWLAAAVCEDLLDAEWLERALQAARQVLDDPGMVESSLGASPLTGIGVLDPACGSGTFLFHAARRIMHCAGEQYGFSPREACRAAAMLVHGMDVHPVAVEMSLAVLRTALPFLEEADADCLSVYAGDALQAARFGEVGEKSVFVPSTRDRQIEIPRALLRRPDFAVIIDVLVKAALNKAKSDFDPLTDFAPGKFPGLGEDLKQDLQRTHDALHEVCSEEGDQVWAWRIRNTAKPLQLSVAKVDRLVGNPPWLIANDTPEGARKTSIHGMFKGYNLHSKSRRGTSSKGDLGALFCARTVDLYLNREGKAKARFGFVLPGSALLGQVWAGFRSGHWKGEQYGLEVQMEQAWDLSGVKEAPFPRASDHACVARGRVKQPAHALPGAERWSVEGAGFGRDWKEIRKRLRSSPVRAFPERAAGVYENDFQIGVLMKSPLCLSLAAEWKESEGVVEFTSYCSTRGKGVWKGKQYEGRIEVEATHPILRAPGLQAFTAVPDALLLAPLREGGEMADLDDWPRQHLPLARKWFQSKDRLFRNNHRTPQDAPALLESINWQNSFIKQYKSGIASPRTGARKVVYNASGKALLACRVPAGMIVKGDCCHAIMRTTDEAAYLVAVLNAPCMQKAWRYFQGSSRGYERSPLQSVPVPAYDRKNPLHVELVQATQAAEKAVRQKEQDQEDLDTVVRWINRSVARLLPAYARERAETTANIARAEQLLQILKPRSASAEDHDDVVPDPDDTGRPEQDTDNNTRRRNIDYRLNRAPQAKIADSPGACRMKPEYADTLRNRARKGTGDASVCILNTPDERAVMSQRRAGVEDDKSG